MLLVWFGLVWFGSAVAEVLQSITVYDIHRHESIIRGEIMSIISGDKSLVTKRSTLMGKNGAFEAVVRGWDKKIFTAVI